MTKRGSRIQLVGGDACGFSVRSLFLSIILFFALALTAHADLGPENVLVLVNADSATSRYIAKMYREYYPAITDVQVLQLSGLPDCSGPASTAADEIITRDQYNTLIAEPVRQHLLDNNLLDQVIVIVTTAGMPYRIEDTTFEDVVYPAGSNYNRVLQYTGQIDAASVESELTCLWYADEFGLANRTVNPYQGYRGSSITLFDRLSPGTKEMIWTTALAVTGTAPQMEGVLNLGGWPPAFGTVDRSFSPGDIYLTCRLDGPKPEGKSAVFAVRELLGRSQKASDLNSGVDSLSSVVVIDDAPSNTLDSNRIYNLDGSMEFYTYSTDTPQPPDAPRILTRDDYSTCYEVMVDQIGVVDGVLNTGYMDLGYGLKVIMDRRVGYRTSQDDLGQEENLIFLCTYGKNGDEGDSSDYLLNGANGVALFDLANGAVFSSFESFNGITMFSDVQSVPVAQGKIVDFISIGGSGAIGHAFEPIATAAVDNTYFAYNMFADADGDGFADLTFVEAAFTSIPFLSWTEVVIGDPLMRIAYGPGETQAWVPLKGDLNGDGLINSIDMMHLVVHNRNTGHPSLYDPDPEKREDYKDLHDLNQDGRNGLLDFVAMNNILSSL